MATNWQDDLPQTLRAQEATPVGGRPRVFEPALKQFACAFQLGDYAWPDEQERLKWEVLRSEVRTHLLELVANSRWRDHLVLRGSALMQVWFGEAARDPKDLDWVFAPHHIEKQDALAQKYFAELMELAKQHPRTANTQIRAERIAWDEIWTYERAAGRRLVFPFETANGQGREIQMDIVWNEVLWQDPVLTAFPTRGEGDLQLYCATPALSLAWKLLWLVGDMFPQGKDLYDAVLLAEHLNTMGEPLDFVLLRQVFDGDEWWAKHPLALKNFRDIFVDWENFQIEYPFIEGEAADWQARLVAALAPTFGD